jgi:transposase-like protein
MRETFPRCPNPYCSNHRTERPRSINHRGWYYRKHDRRHINQYCCGVCRTHFSDATWEPTRGQQKPEINGRVRELLMSSTSERRIALIMGVTRATVARRIRFLASEARRVEALERAKRPKVLHVQMDEMETFEHTKCKPLSIPLVVETGSTRILEIDVARMPPKGPLAAIALKKYGPRADERSPVMERMLERLKMAAVPHVHLRSDMCPRYGPLVFRVFPLGSHETHRSRRGCVVGYGEMKATGNDPLFSLNHTAAMLRDNLKRLARRTWCTSKRPDRLHDLLWIYAHYHNQVMIRIRHAKPTQVRKTMRENASLSA